MAAEFKCQSSNCIAILSARAIINQRDAGLKGSFSSRILLNPFIASYFGGNFLYGQRIQQLFLRSLGQFHTRTAGTRFCNSVRAEFEEDLWEQHLGVHVAASCMVDKVEECPEARLFVLAVVDSIAMMIMKSSVEARDKEHETSTFVCLMPITRALKTSCLRLKNLEYQGTYIGQQEAFGIKIPEVTLLRRPGWHLLQAKPQPTLFISSIL